MITEWEYSGQGYSFAAAFTGIALPVFPANIGGAA